MLCVQIAFLHSAWLELWQKLSWAGKRAELPGVEILNETSQSESDSLAFNHLLWLYRIWTREGLPLFHFLLWNGPLGWLRVRWISTDVGGCLTVEGGSNKRLLQISGPLVSREEDGWHVQGLAALGSVVLSTFLTAQSLYLECPLPAAFYWCMSVYSFFRI